MPHALEERTCPNEDLRSHAATLLTAMEYFCNVHKIPAPHLSNQLSPSCTASERPALTGRRACPPQAVVGQKRKRDDPPGDEDCFNSGLLGQSPKMVRMGSLVSATPASSESSSSPPMGSSDGSLPFNRNTLTRRAEATIALLNAEPIDWSKVHSRWTLLHKRASSSSADVAILDKLRHMLHRAPDEAFRLMALFSVLVTEAASREAAHRLHTFAFKAASYSDANGNQRLSSFALLADLVEHFFVFNTLPSNLQCAACLVECTLQCFEASSRTGAGREAFVAVSLRLCVAVLRLLGGK